MTVKISVYVIAFNEAEKIRDAIESVLWADEVILVDSHSTDGTTEIAQALGASVVHVKFTGYGALRNEALKNCSHEWIFSLDADERCTPEAKEEILRTINNEGALDAYLVPRKNYFMGRWIRYSGWYPNYRQPQLFRNGAMSYDLLPVHEGYILHSNKPLGRLKEAILQFPFKDVGEIMRKADKYSTLGAEKIKHKRITVGIAFAHATWSFLKHYVFKRGFLDGGPGLVIAVGNFEGTFYRYLKAMKLESARHLK
jgi:glycosyltransferase involved in cell wall biosynthesis